MVHAPAVLCEVCVDSVEGALAAQAGGADRIELCGPLGLGGITPSLGLVREVRAQVSLPIHVMVRPHDRDFHYSTHELQVMLRDIAAFQHEDVQGCVFGALRHDGQLDQETMHRLVQAAAPLSTTCHRAFDEVADPLATLTELMALGVHRLLTSGGRPTAPEGLSLLRSLVNAAGSQLCILPGGGITPENVQLVLEGSGAHEVHFSGRIPANVSAGPRFSPPALPMQVTSQARIAAIVAQARSTQFPTVAFPSLSPLSSFSSFSLRETSVIKSNALFAERTATVPRVTLA